MLICTTIILVVEPAHAPVDQSDVSREGLLQEDLAPPQHGEEEPGNEVERGLSRSARLGVLPYTPNHPGRVTANRYGGFPASCPSEFDEQVWLQEVHVHGGP